MTTNNDEYDITQYTDEELIHLLGLNHPSDRELEAKIIMMINKYSNFQNESGYKIAIFYQNIYKHFFDIKEEDEEKEDEEKDIIEGFETNIDISSNTKIEKITPIQTQLFDYSKNPSGTNPLLKQTIKRIISIDSQFRNKQFQPISTDYTFNLSEPLKDVVSLKLYSINIPYTWYTVSKAYGANLIFLKGNSPGINNGLHDYQISIPPGNYGPVDLSNAINFSIQDLQSKNSDMNFGQTAILYDDKQIKMKFNTDIQKVYNESYYKITFSDINMAGFLGFNSPTYSFNTIYSNICKLTDISFNINNSNNFFTIYRYIPYTFAIINKINYGYPNANTILKKYDISLCDINSNNNYIIPKSNSYTTSQIQTFIKNGFLNYNILNGNVFSSTCGTTYNTNTSQWNFTIDFNRYNLVPKLTPNEKIAIVFPDISNNGQNLWINNSNNSLFNFNNSINDLSTLNGTNPVILNQISISNSYIWFKCTRPNYNFNDISFTNISLNKGYVTDYYSLVNNYFQNKTINGFNFTNTFMKNIYNNNNTFLNFNIEFSKQITTQYYSVEIYSKIDSIPLLNTYFNININREYDLSANNLINSTFNYQRQLITLNNPSYYLFTFYPNKTENVENYYDISYDVWFIPNKKIYNDYYELINELQSNLIIYKTQTKIQDTTHFNKTSFNIVINPISFTDADINYNMNISFNIINTLTQNDYILDISSNYTYVTNQQEPPDSITNEINILSYFGLDLSYNLSKQSSNENGIFINGKYDIKSNAFPNKNTSSITFQSLFDLSGVGSQNSFQIIIPPQNYDINTLTSYINTKLTQFTTNSSLSGSFFNLININNQNYISFYSNINIIYTSKDYNLVFFDPYSFIKCLATANSIANATWDTTLGWTLGFRDYISYQLILSNLSQNQYYLTSTKGSYTYNPNINNINGLEINTLITLTGDTTVTTNLYNYFLIVLDDFIQNHLNDGLVTITKPETQLPTQSYASMSNKICDTNGQVISLSTSNTPGNNLTQKQLYALNTVQLSNKINYNINYSKGPYVQDIFGIVPIKPGTNGQTYVEFGGTLQNQERQYFGPVNIHRMAIQLVNDKGDIVDLNNSEWSFSLICEQLYNSAS